MKKKTWEKVTAAAAAVALTVSMAGCGANEKKEQSGNGDTITIEFAEHVANIEEQEPHMMKIIEAFEKEHPNIKIDITGKEVSEHNKQMTLLADENKLPDIFWLEQAPAKEFAQNGYLYDMTEALDEYGINESLLPGLVNSCTVDEKDFGLPSEVMMAGFFYNKALFEEAGIEEAPETYEEFTEAVNKLNDAGIVPLTVGAQDNYSIWAFETMLARYGFFDKLEGLNDGSVSWNNEDFIHYFEKVEEMRDNKTFTENIANMGYFEAKEQFLGGQAAMFNSGAWDIGDFEASDIAQDIGFFWGPTFSDSEYPQQIGIKASGGVYVVSAKAAEDKELLDAIMQFWQFYYGEEGTKIIVEDTAALPCSQYEGEVNVEEHPVLATMIQALNDDWEAVREPFNSLSSTVAYGYFDATFGVMTGVYTPEEAADYVEDLHSAER